MKKILFALGLLLACGGVSAKTLTIGVDLSGSNVLITHQNFAYGASQYLSKEIEKLKTGDVVVLRTFGSRQNAGNLLTSEYVVSRRNKPRKIAAVIARYLQSLPSKVDVSQSSTNLLAWLDFSSGFNCGEKSSIIVLTDALESSSLVDAQSFLDGKKPLPDPENDLKGCSLTFYGLGAGLPAQYVRTMRKQWRDWSEKAGADFTAVIP